MSGNRYLSFEVFGEDSDRLKGCRVDFTWRLVVSFVFSVLQLKSRCCEGFSVFRNDSQKKLLGWNVSAVTQ